MQPPGDRGEGGRPDDRVLRRAQILDERVVERRLPAARPNPERLEIAAIERIEAPRDVDEQRQRSIRGNMGRNGSSSTYRSTARVSSGPR